MAPLLLRTYLGGMYLGAVLAVTCIVRRDVTEKKIRFNEIIRGVVAATKRQWWSE